MLGLAALVRRILLRKIRHRHRPRDLGLARHARTMGRLQNDRKEIMKSKHTEGKWILHNPDERPSTTARGNQADKRIMVLHPDGERLIACCNTGTTSSKGSIPREERIANARLIAAAPELLEALEAVVNDATDFRKNMDKRWLPMAQEAISKAKGIP